MLIRLSKYFGSCLFMIPALALYTGCDSSLPGIAHSASVTADYLTENVVIIVIDGPRFKDSWGDPTKKNTPYFANELASVGINHNRFYNRGATYTTSGHAAITTGNYQWMSNDGSEIPFHPSIFQKYLQKHQVNPNQVQIVTSKQKLEVLADCGDPNLRGRFNPMAHSSNRDDQETLETALSVISQHHPRLALIHFRGPDFYGHGNDWDNYLNSIRQTDRFTYEIWQHLQNDPFYKDVTTLMVTNDHGRHSDGIRDGFISHGDFCEGCMHINFYAAGPDFHANREINKPRQLVDVASTVAVLMDIDLPASTGMVMWELFK